MTQISTDVPTHRATALRQLGEAAAHLQELQAAYPDPDTVIRESGEAYLMGARFTAAASAAFDGVTALMQEPLDRYDSSAAGDALLAVRHLDRQAAMWETLSASATATPVGPSVQTALGVEMSLQNAIAALS